MSNLLSDLLSYVRVQKEEHYGKIEISEIVQIVTNEHDSSGQFEVSIGNHCSELSTFPTAFTQILRNVLVNSMRHHDHCNGRIDVSLTFSANKVLCVVSDDGPGIDPKHHERVFEVFQTLRPRDEVEGSGVGLAVVQKLLDYHNGDICIKSNPKVERGTTIIFSLPASLNVSESNFPDSRSWPPSEGLT